MLQIHSKYKDYYDPALRQISSLDHFIRIQDHRKEVVVGDLPKGVAKLELDNRLQYLFFCGSVYPFLVDDKMRLRVRHNNPHVYDYDNTPSFLWSLPEIQDYLQKYDQLHFCFSDILPQMFVIRETDLLHDIQLASGVCSFVFNPVYSYRYNKNTIADIAGSITLYPCLQNLHFYKIVDPYTAAQQIDYWLSNIFVSDNCPNTQTDAQKIVAHGHDLRVSFRSASGKGKKKNEKKRC